MPLASPLPPPVSSHQLAVDDEAKLMSLVRSGMPLPDALAILSRGQSPVSRSPAQIPPTMQPPNAPNPVTTGSQGMIVQPPGMGPQGMGPQLASAQPQPAPMAPQLPQMGLNAPPSAGEFGALPMNEETQQGFLGKDKDFWTTVLQAGLATMAAGSKPGATALGALGEGGLSAMQMAQQREAQQSRLEETQKRTGISEEYLALAQEQANRPNYQNVKGVGLVDVSDPENPQIIMPETPEGSSEKPINLKMPDGSERAFRLDDPRLDRALRAGGIVTGTGDSEDRQLVEIYDPESPTGTRLVPRPEAAGQPGKPGSGLSVEYDPETGGLRVTQGRGVTGGGSLSKPVQTDIETDLRSSSEGLARLSDIQSRFKREYQTVPFRWGQITSAWQEKLTGSEVSPEAQEELGEYTAFRRDAIDNINRYIKEITGAQMSEAEAKRLRKGVPDPGEGLFDGDAPTEFQSKMDATFRSLRKAAARQGYALSNNLDWKAIPLDDIEKIMKRRAQEIAQELQATNPEIDEDALRAELQQRIVAEFGLTLQ